MATQGLTHSKENFFSFLRMGGKSSGIFQGLQSWGLLRCWESIHRQVTGKGLERRSASSPAGPKLLAQGFCKADAGSSRAAQTAATGGTVLMQTEKLKATMGCTYRSNSTRSGDEVSGDWINSGFPSSCIVCFSHWIKYQMVESLSLTASEADAVLERTHRKKSHMNNFLTGLIRPFSWSLQSPGPFFPHWLSPPPFALQVNEKSLVEMSYIEGQENTSTDWKGGQQHA